MLLESFIAVSGIFSKKDEELDILPPPPPFPEIGKEEKIIKDAERERKKRERERRKEELKREKEEEKRRKWELAEKHKKEKLREERRKARKEKVFDFLHGLGLVKTEEEKKKIEKQRQEYKKNKEATKKREEELRRKSIEERQKEIEMKAREEEKQHKELERKKVEEEKAKGKRADKKEREIFKEIPDVCKDELYKKPKKRILGKIFGKKKDEVLDMELEELEKIKIEPIKAEGIKEFEAKKFEFPEEKFEKRAVKREEAAEEEKEIQQAIGAIKVKKKQGIVRGLFKKEEEIGERVEMPEVMPRVEGKVDYVELIEEKIHKARLALMDFNFDDAKRAYIEIMKIYDELDSKKKLKVYQDIKDLYYERKSAEKFVK